MTDQNTRPQPSEPMLSEAETRRLVEHLEARIKATEKLERAIATRPQPSAEPVAYLYEDKSGYREAVATRVIDGAWRTNGWTETPLYPASALEAARREALEQADEGGEGMTISDKLAALKAKRDALNAEIALIEVGIQRAAYDACLVEQYLRFNERRLAEGKRQLSASEYAAGVFDEEAS